MVRRTGVFETRISVLVVEDDAAQRVMMDALLHVEGYAPISVPNGADALVRLRSGMPAKVILLDLMMPVMDGWAFLRAQQEDPSLAHIPVIVTTAEEHPLSRELRADAIFAKPLDMMALMACVRELSADGWLRTKTSDRGLYHHGATKRAEP